jgi:hypothetical protein
VILWRFQITTETMELMLVTVTITRFSSEEPKGSVESG